MESPGAGIRVRFGQLRCRESRDGFGWRFPTTGQCKQGMDINWKGQWGCHPPLVSLANTGEPLYLVNRRGSRPSHEGAAAR